MFGSDKMRKSMFREEVIKWIKLMSDKANIVTFMYGFLNCIGHIDSKEKEKIVKEIIVWRFFLNIDDKKVFWVLQFSWPMDEVLKSCQEGKTRRKVRFKLKKLFCF